ncbi:MAG: hypothetical protein M3Z01_02110, partial [Thermoproteota archaeon]|nr:hypothetical protein [Thermoproteota archaeon]
MKTRFTYISKHTIFILLFFCARSAHSQPNSIKDDAVVNEINPNDSISKLHLRNVFVTGNRKTKDYIILREMQIKPGDSIPIIKLNDELVSAKQHIFNTTLFLEVAVEPIIISAFDFDIKVTVKERWYIFPLPELQFVDGSINKWLAKYKGDLNRLNYGLKFTHKNLTGRNDELRIHLLNGYTRTVYFNYNAPYSNAALTNGFSFGGGYFQNREIPYKTAFDNNLLNFKKNDFVSHSWNINAGYSIRKAIKTSQLFSVGYTFTSIDDSIISLKYNNNYFNKPKSKTGYVDLDYTLQYIDVNNVLYPVTGISGKLSLLKRGLELSGGINVFSITGEVNKYWALGKKWYAGTQLQGNIKLPFNQPYINQHSFGYGNTYVRGLEYKIIDGIAYALSKFNLKKEIANFNVNTPFKKSKIINKIPFKIYAKTFADMGYSFNKKEFATQLNNTFLGSAGFG